jgi:hypothetical protein
MIFLSLFCDGVFLDYGVLRLVASTVLWFGCILLRSLKFEGAVGLVRKKILLGNSTTRHT